MQEKLVQQKLIDRSPKTSHLGAVQASVVFISRVEDHVEVSADEPRARTGQADVAELLQERRTFVPGRWAVDVG
jgi:hypothetical protein